MSDTKVEMFVGLHSLKKNGKESSFVNWLSNLAEVSGSTQPYPSNIGAIPVALAGTNGRTTK